MNRSKQQPIALVIGTIAVLLLLIVSIVTITQLRAVNQDTKTQAAASNVADKLTSYLYDATVVPESLSVIGINHLPAHTTYRKISDQAFQFCVNYRRANNGVNAFTVFDNALYGSTGSYDYKDSQNLYISLKHPKGADCQKITPQLKVAQATKPFQQFVKNSDGTYTVCGVHTDYFDAEGHVTAGVDKYPDSLTMNAISYPYAGAYQLSKFSPQSQVFDAACKPITPADLKAGDRVSVFDITQPTSNAISIFLRRDR